MRWIAWLFLGSLLFACTDDGKRADDDTMTVQDQTQGDVDLAELGDEGELDASNEDSAEGDLSQDYDIQFDIKVDLADPDTRDLESDVDEVDLTDESEVEEIDAVDLVEQDSEGDLDGESDWVADADIEQDVMEVADADVVDLVDTVDAIDAVELTDIADQSDAQGPFDDLESLSDETLKAALLGRIDDQTDLGYSGDGIARELMFSFIDEVDGRVECIYTGRSVVAENPEAPPVGDDMSLDEIDNTPGTDCQMADGTVVDCDFNTEHSWPRSQGANSAPAESDLHHLFPSWDYANNMRSSYDFGETVCEGEACDWAEGGSELGDNLTSSTVFQVRPKFRGDIARAQFYFSVRYDRGIDTTQEQVLRQWHLDDPVDDQERIRNDRIELWQGNRNPFVDRPDFVDRIADF